MIRTTTYLHQRLLSPATGRISEVCLIEADGTADLPVYLEWLRAMRVRRGILLLVNIATYDAAALQAIHDITALGIDVLPVQYPGTVNAKPGKPNSYALPAADIMLGSAGEGGQRTLYIDNYGKQDFKSLRHDHRFRSAIRRLGYQTIACRDEGLPALEGGDCLMVGDHLFLGRRTQERFGIHAACDIKQFYHLGPEVQVHCIGVEDPAPEEGLYHLDLYFAYGGKDEYGRHRFLTGYIDDDSIGDNVIVSMQRQLDGFRRSIEQTLDECYGASYVLVPVPIIVCDIYRVSPLNGITECVNGQVRYYFPWPTYGGAKEHPHYNIQERVMAAMQRAWDILSDQLGEQALVRCPVPIHYMTGSGQSLHCTMGIIGRTV